MKKTVIYFHSLSSPWAYMGWPGFRELIRKHDLDVVVRPTRIVPPNGGIPLRSRPQARQDYHEVELDRWRKRLNMPLVLRPKHYPTNNEFCARMVIAADKLGWDALALSHGLLHALWSEEKDVKEAAVRVAVAKSLGMDGDRLLAMQDTPRDRGGLESEREGSGGSRRFRHADLGLQERSLLGAGSSGLSR